MTYDKWYMLYSHLTETDAEESNYRNQVRFVKGENNIKIIKNKMLNCIASELEKHDETDIMYTIMHGFHVTKLSESIIVRYDRDDVPEYFAMVCSENKDSILFENVDSIEYKDFIEKNGENLKILNGDLDLSVYESNNNTVRLYKYREEE